MTVRPSDLPLLRPALLWRAARLGLPAYRREPVLRRLLGGAPPAREAVIHLAALEARHEAARCEGSGAYSPARHLEALIALLAERAAAVR